MRGGKEASEVKIMKPRTVNNMRNLAPVLLVALTSSCLIIAISKAQFMPQSHLGRFVQSIAGSSPLVHLRAQSGTSNFGSPFDSDPSSSFKHLDEAHANHFEADQGPTQVSGAENPSYHDQRSRGLALQQEQSQHRGIPQTYHSASSSNRYKGRHHNEEDDTDHHQDHGKASSSSRPSQEYQMGAYLGPSMDDKELNGVFNNNDDRDDIDAGSYDDGSNDMRTGYRKHAASSNHYPRDESDVARPGEAYPYGEARQTGSRGSNAAPSYRGYGNSGYDEDSADEDDGPTMRANDGSNGASSRRGRGGEYARGYPIGSLNQAASQSRQQRQKGIRNSQKTHGNQDDQNQQLMVAAANGYSPYGYASGPVDLTSILSGMNPNYQTYQADTYPGQNYYNQQGNPGGKRNQEASSNRGNNWDSSSNQAGAHRSNERGRQGNHEEDVDGDMDDD